MDSPLKWHHLSKHLAFQMQLFKYSPLSVSKESSNLYKKNIVILIGISSTEHFKMFPQLSCLIAWKITLAAFV